ncbi:MAG: decarboxylase [Candidatus Altiarchaeota archaeon]|nr:decarboxylase [Candidatus Altiarchaeota archaeon]
MAKFLLDKDIAIKQYNSLTHLGEIWYNIKTNPEVGKILEKHTNAIFTSTGIGNLTHLNDLKRAVMLLQGESIQEIKNLVDKGVKGFIVDNEVDLNKLLKVTDDTQLFLRLKFKEHTIYTGKYFVYGINWNRASELIKNLSMDVGIHFHRKTQNIGEWSLVDDISPIISSLEGQITSVNIGGGLPSTYHNSKPLISPILKNIENLKNHLKEKNMKLILEPGRYICAPAVKLETSILNIYDKNLVVDASIYNAAMDTYLYHIRLKVQGEKQSGHRYLIKGRSPDSLDIFRYKVFFDKEKKVGDKITFLNAGAYNFHTDFSDLPKIPTEIIHK